MRPGWFIFCLCVSLCAPTFADGPVVFKDKNLEAAVRAELRIPSANFTQSDLHRVKNLTCYDPIADLEGLERCVNLTGLVFISKQNTFTDTSVFAKLTTLRYLDITCLYALETSSLAACTGLTDLRIDGGLLKNIDFCRPLKNLKYLSLYRTLIKDLGPLSGIKGLEDLRLGNNEISDLSPLAGLVGLEYLELEENRIEDVSPLARLVNLKNLYLKNNRVSDIYALKALVRLEMLDLSDNPVTDISALVYMAELNTLMLNKTRITDIGVLSVMVQKGAFRFAGKDLNTRIEMMHVPVSFAPGTKARAVYQELRSKSILIWTEQIQG